MNDEYVDDRLITFFKLCFLFDKFNSIRNLKNVYIYSLNYKQNKNHDLDLTETRFLFFIQFCPRKFLTTFNCIIQLSFINVLS